MNVEILDSGITHVTRRMTLPPGEATPWHVDPCRRYSVVMGGERLAIEFLHSAERQEFAVYRGMAGWDEPDSRVHRAVNTGLVPFVEVVTFLRASTDVDVQPVMEKTPD